MIARRKVLGILGALGAAAGGLGALAPARALALGEDEATALVRLAADEVLSLVREPGDATSKAGRLRLIMERRASFDRIAQFSAGRIWREMSDAEKARYLDAFKDYVSRVYARRFAEYSGETIDITSTVDAGKKGIVVRSQVAAASGGEPIPVDWLVSDRGGDGVKIADIVIEGISMATTQREEIGALYDSKGGQVGELIAALGTF